MRVYIDLDSGTVVSGPVYVVDVPDSDIDSVLESDDSARAYAIDYGRRLS